MKLDKELYRQAYELHRQYNEAELRGRIRHVDQRPPGETWRQYVALWEFCMKLAPHRLSQHQEQQRAADLERYYTRMQKFAEWRQSVGKAT